MKLLLAWLLLSLVAAGVWAVVAAKVGWRKPEPGSPRPLWRWWLFCVACWLHFNTPWQWPLTLLGWCVLPKWVADGDLPPEIEGLEVPF